MCKCLNIKIFDKYGIQIFSKHQPSGSMLSISQNVHMFVCLSVCVFVCSHLRYHVNAPTSQSGMSKVLRDLASLGKSAGNQWSQIGKNLLIKGV